MGTIRRTLLVCFCLALAWSASAAQDPGSIVDPDIVAQLDDGGIFAQGATPCEVLVTVGTGSGEPGQSGRPVQVQLQSNEPVTHLEFEVHDIPDRLTADGCNALQGGFTCDVTDTGDASVIFSSTSTGVGPGAGFTILELLYTVDPGAPSDSINLVPMLLSAINDKQEACSVAGMPGSFAVSVCGNGIVEGIEECDDGNTEGGDCCAATCAFEPHASQCDDGAYCTVGDECDGAGACAAGTARVCDDGIPCTTDTCDETADICAAVPLDAVCDNGIVCDGDESCSPSQGCVAGPPLDCDDGVACTDDFCNEEQAGCFQIPRDTLCDNGLFCDGVESCDAVTDCQAGTPVACDDGDLCTDDTCDEGTADCVFDFDSSNDPVCACGNGVLDPGEECDDGNVLDGDCCTSTCTAVAAATPCDDGAFCTVGENCDGAGSCGGSLPRDCGDGIDCTTDTCDDLVDQCFSGADNTACDDGVFCTQDVCDVGAGGCVQTPIDSVCDNGLFCDGVESCDPVTDCQAGIPVICDDDDLCTDDSCDEGVAGCLFVFDSGNDPICACGDGILDPGEECDDGNPFDDDCCTSTCTIANPNTPCEDGAFCTVGESCDNAGVCGGGTPRDCSDTVGCTSDSCNEVFDQCDNAANDGVCSDGMFCNGAEQCHPTLDCQPGVSTCPAEFCDEELDTCSIPGIPTTGEWALILMALALLGSGYWIFGRKA